MDAAAIISAKLNIPTNYLTDFSKLDKVDGFVHNSWIREVIHNRELPGDFLLHKQLCSEEISAWFKQGENIGADWQKVLFSIIKKRAHPVIPLPRAKPRASSETPLSYTQILHYVAHTNHKNLWKEAFKKYSSGAVRGGPHDSSTVQLTDSASVVRDVIWRAYACPIVPLEGVVVPSSPETHTADTCQQTHPNLLPCVVAFEAKDLFILLHQKVPVHTLLDCATFSPALLSTLSRPVFIIYQLLCLLRHIHDLGLVLGDVSLADIYVDSHLWIHVIPRFDANLYEWPREGSVIAEQRVDVVNEKRAEEGGKQLQDLSSLTLAWVQGSLSNLDYLTALNNLAGRRIGDPRCHHILPWVTDFSDLSGANWRDLTKSKFRLNKGDRQLDLTYDLPPSSKADQVPHHVSDMLSEITYYVYLARVTPRAMLCQYVRPQWVPAEYPSSIQRLQQWTPDECIPEFFTDPSVFKSMHPDLPDLEIPVWASSADQLVAHHRALLESSYVSDRLHHWIDLTFGYKLTGQAAVRSKNVCLQLVDGHTGLRDCGVVQLFSSPHPARAMSSPYWAPTPPRIHYRPKNKTGSDEDDGDSSGGEDKDINSSQTPLAQSKLLSKSRSSLVQSVSPGERITIGLPHDYNPVSQLLAVEALHILTGSGVPLAPAPSQAALCKQVVAARRHTEMQVLGCLIAEMFLSVKLHLFHKSQEFSQRLSDCRIAFSGNRDSVPRCVRSLVSLLLDECGGSEGVVTGVGAPAPSAHQLLQSTLSAALLPLPPATPAVYTLVRALHEFTVAVSVLQDLHIDHPNHEQPLASAIETLSEWKVETAASHVQRLADQNLFHLDLILSHVIALLADPDTAVSTAWHLFGPVAKALGPVASGKVLLEPILRLYDCNAALSSPHHLKKRIKLYHRSFLLRLIVRFRLRVFLEHFVAPLVEAVGGYHDIHLMPPKHLSSEIEEAIECSDVLSPMEEDSSADSERTMRIESAISTQSEPEVFVLDGEDGEVRGEGEVEVQDGSEDHSQQIASLLRDLQVDEADEPATDEEGEVERGELLHATRIGPAPHFDKSGLFEVSEVAVASVLWLAYRLGPVLTASHLTKNLLRMLSLCYTTSGCTQLRGAQLQGDDSAASVLHCLSTIVGLYGEQLVVVQFLAAATDVILHARRRLTASLEAGVVAHLALLTHCLALLSDNTLQQLFQDVILSRVCGPALRLLASTRQLFPGGAVARRALALKLSQCLHALMLRVTTEQRIALLHTIAKLFLVFSKARGLSEEHRGDDLVDKLKEYESTGSFSPPKPDSANSDSIKSKALEELCTTLTAELAHFAYSPVVIFFGESLLEQSLKNHGVMRQLVKEHLLSRDHLRPGENQEPDQWLGSGLDEGSVGSFGTNVVIIGNRIDLQEPVAQAESPGSVNEDRTLRPPDNTSRELQGNWLSYWQHEVTNPSARLSVKQIRLLGFTGHSSSVRALTVLDNENSFLSASRDKTVKVWSLRSTGDGSASCPPQWTYTGHRKAVLSVGFSESARLAVSCDSAVHLWDPYVGRVVSQTEPRSPVNTLRPLPPPSHLVLAATTEPSLRSFDSRIGTFVNDLKVVSSSAGLIRCLAVAPGGSWVALGQASGFLTVIDLRTGTVIAAWRAHDGEVLQLVAVNDNTIVSSSLDQAISVWSPSDGKLKFNMKGPTEPVHCLDMYGGELVTGTTANRIGVYTSVEPLSTFSSQRLRSDMFRGVLTTLQVLPLNRLLLLAADSGTMTLIC